MREVDVQQGTPEWHAHRAKTHNASDAPAMMGASPYVSRTELVRRVATGIVPEVDPATQRRFDDGHRVEPALRALAESLTGEEFFPVVAVSGDGYLGASFDGVTMDEEIIFEGKQSNASKIADIERDVIPPVDYWQIVHQFAVAEKAVTCLYLVGDGSKSGTAHMVIDRDRVKHDIPKLRAAWEQLDKDVAAYAPEPAAPIVVAAPVTALPAVTVQIDGQIAVRENFAVFETAARDFIENKLIRKPETDQDFADLDLQIKAMKNAEAALDAAESQMLAQIQTVDAAKRHKDALHKLIRDNRLMAERLLTNEKDRRRGEIVEKSRKAYAFYVEAVNHQFVGRATLPVIAADFAGAVKGKRTIASITEACETELARVKVEIDLAAKDITTNLAVIDEIAKEHAFLVRDVRDLVTVNPAHLPGVIKGRIAEYEAEQQRKLDAERERIRREEQERADRAAQAEKDRELEAERQRARDELANARAELEQKFEAQRMAVNASPREELHAALESTSKYEASAAAEAIPEQTPESAFRPGMVPTLRLGEINQRIAPLSISAEGLAQLGFPAVTIKAAKLYHEQEFPAICIAIGKRLRAAMEAHPVKEAA